MLNAVTLTSYYLFVEYHHFECRYTEYRLYAERLYAECRGAKNILNKSNRGAVFKTLHILHKLQMGPIS